VGEKNPYYKFDEIEKQRYRWKQDHSRIQKNDFGTGRSQSVRISKIASGSLCSPRKGKLLCRLINYLNLNSVLELGTSLGISTAYLVAGSKSRKCITLEGCENTSAIARQTFEALQLENIEMLTGNIDNTLHKALDKLPEFDFVYIDANHTLEATIRYFELILPKLSSNAVVVIDDIYWSKEMKMSWEHLKTNPKVTSTFDLFHFGIIFLNPDLNKKHYKLFYLDK